MDILNKLKAALSQGAQETSQEIEVLRATLNPKVREGKYESIAGTIHEITEKQGEVKAIGKMLRLIEVEIGRAEAREKELAAELKKEAAEAEEG
jgi:hypothetical protein